MTLVQINQSVAKIISSINEIQVSQSLLILITKVFLLIAVERINHARSTLIEII